MSLRKNINKPVFEFSGNTITISGRSIMEDPIEEWGKFITSIRVFMNGVKNLEVNFMLDGISSSNSLYLSNVFSVFNEHRNKCKIIVNWYYLDVDEDMEFLGEHYQERNSKLSEFNLISRK